MRKNKLTIFFFLFIFSIISISIYSAPVQDNLVLWLSADSITGVSNGQTISTWSDLASPGTNAYSSGSSMPTYQSAGINGKASLHFDGVDDYMSISGSSDFAFTEITMFVIMTTGSGATVSVAKDGTQTEQEYLLGWNNAYHHTQDGNYTYKVPDTPLGSYYIATYQAGASPYDLDYRINGITSNAAIVQSGSVSNMTAVTRNVTIGRRTSYSNREPFAGDIAEILIYNTKLSTSDIESVENYLGSKYLGAAMHIPEPFSFIYIGIALMGLLVRKLYK